MWLLPRSEKCEKQLENWNYTSSSPIAKKQVVVASAKGERGSKGCFIYCQNFWPAGTSRTPCIAFEMSLESMNNKKNFCRTRYVCLVASTSKMSVMMHCNLLPIATFSGIEKQCNRFGRGVCFFLFKQTNKPFVYGRMTNWDTNLNYKGYLWSLSKLQSRHIISHISVFRGRAVMYSKCNSHLTASWMHHNWKVTVWWHLVEAVTHDKNS